MSSAFPLPFKVASHLEKTHSEILNRARLCGEYFPPFHLKQAYKYQQWFHQQSQNNFIKVHFLQLLNLHISVNMVIIKKINSMTLGYSGFDK